MWSPSAQDEVTELIGCGPVSGVDLFLCSLAEEVSPWSLCCKTNLSPWVHVLGISQRSYLSNLLPLQWLECGKNKSGDG